jgi:hypothetical protein
MRDIGRLPLALVYIIMSATCFKAELALVEEPEWLQGAPSASQTSREEQIFGFSASFLHYP